MDLKAQLEQICEETESLEALAFGDLSSGTVLVAAAADTVMQEEFDALLASAAEMLGEGAGDRCLSDLAPSRAPRALEALTLGASEAQVFVRSPTALDEVLCGRCRPETDFAHLLPRLHQVLQGMGALQ